MDPTNSNTWHRKRDQTIESIQYSISKDKVHHLLNGYVAYDIIKQYILSVATDNIIYDYEYDTVSNLIEELNLGTDIDLVPMNIDYKTIVTNYDEVVDIIDKFNFGQLIEESC